MGTTPSGLISNPPPSIPLIFTPDALPAATLPIYPGLGQAQEYAGLHTHIAWFNVCYLLSVITDNNTPHKNMLCHVKRACERYTIFKC